MSDYQKAFGKNIRRLRLLRDLKQEQLAEKSELSVQILGAIERGTGNPTLSTLEKIALALSVNVEELFVLEEFRRSAKEIREELLAQIEKCKDSELMRLYACNKILLSRYD